jgi:hypothetical protein
MEKLDRVRKLIIETVTSYNVDWELELDLTEFIKAVNNPSKDLDELDDFVTDYLYENILEKEYEVGDFWKYIYKEVAGLN